MDALKLADTPRDKRKFDSKCKELLSIAERIKRLKGGSRRDSEAESTNRDTSSSAATCGLPPRCREPVSTRSLSNREQIILLEDSKLNGFVFPPWAAFPEEEQFELHEDSELFTYVTPPSLFSFHVLTLGRDAAELSLSPEQGKAFMGWKRPRDLLAEDVAPGDGDPAEPTMLPTEPMDLVQDVTSDCSVVASLCTGVSLGGRNYSKVLPSIHLHPRIFLGLRWLTLF